MPSWLKLFSLLNYQKNSAYLKTIRSGIIPIIEV
jgi:hypothetical protein